MLMMASFSEVAAMSSTMWVERRTMRSLLREERRLRKRTRSSGSRPAVGSSTMRSLGLLSRAWAMPSLRFMPPESFLTF